ncbi:unnamed protein product [Arctia plantaginis]|uniref:Uncharacterized protein n=1 Tax=Arctia plantaginis TaxID=874455 RepID=A0A8S1AGH7_ARCPL|nr:unnamed protein product [Arctia plantaginis]CAB3260477.1 unnamed protein product [Arctia plantaginis]
MDMKNLHVDELRQEGATIKNCNSNYITKCSALTKRMKRGEPYRTNVTFTTVVPFTNNVTMKYSYGVKGYPNMLSIKTKICDILNITWLKEYIGMFSDIPLSCPVKPGSYGFYNMEFPPKNLPLPIPKGDIYFTCIVETTDTNELITHLDLVLRSK